MTPGGAPIAHNPVPTNLASARRLLSPGRRTRRPATRARCPIDPTAGPLLARNPAASLAGAGVGESLPGASAPRDCTDSISVHRLLVKRVGRGGGGRGCAPVFGAIATCQTARRLPPGTIRQTCYHTGRDSLGRARGPSMRQLVARPRRRGGYRRGTALTDTISGPVV